MKISLEYGIIEKENEVSKLKTQIKELMSKLKTVVNENENLSNIKINEINRLNAVFCFLNIKLHIYKQRSI